MGNRENRPAGSWPGPPASSNSAVHTPVAARANRRSCRSSPAGRAPRQERLDRRAGPLRRRRARSRRTRSSSHALAAAWRSTVDRSLSPRRTAATRLRPAACRPRAWSARGAAWSSAPRSSRHLPAIVRTDAARFGAPRARLEMPSGIGRDAAVEPAGAGGGLAAEIRVGSAPGRAGPGEPDAESRASNSICTGCRGTHASPCARCARWCSNATAKDGRHDRRRGGQPPAHRGRQRCRPPPQSRSVTANTAFNDDLAPSLPPASRSPSPFDHGTAPTPLSPAAAPRGSPGVRPRTRSSCPTIPAARGRGPPRPAVEIPWPPS